MNHQANIFGLSLKRLGIFAASLAVGSVLAIGSSVYAKPGIVNTIEGKSIEGDIIEKDDEIIITIRGITTRMNRDMIQSIKYVGSIDDQYKKKLAELPKNITSAQHLDLARWLLDNKAFELAKKEADAALNMDPANSDAQTLQATIQSQMRLDQFKPVPAGTGATPAKPPVVKPHNPEVKPAEVKPNNGLNAGIHKYLTVVQINSLKLSEWPDHDDSVKVVITPDLKKKYMATAKGKASDLTSLSPISFAREVLRNGTADQRNEIKVVNDPAPLAEFRKHVQPIILSHCATAGCHGGAAGGKLFLYGNAGSPESDAPAYTNYYILTQFSATSEGKQRLMIDRTYPDQSLILLYALPPEVSKVVHPQVKGQAIKPVVRNREDAQYKLMSKWIEKLVNPDPKYDFTFSLTDEPVTPPVIVPPTSATTLIPPTATTTPGTPGTSPTTVPAKVPEKPKNPTQPNSPFKPKAN